MYDRACVDYRRAPTSDVEHGDSKDSYHLLLVIRVKCVMSGCEVLRCLSDAYGRSEPVCGAVSTPFSRGWIIANRNDTKNGLQSHF